MKTGSRWRSERHAWWQRVAVDAAAASATEGLPRLQHCRLARLQADAGALVDTLNALDTPGANLPLLVARHAVPYLRSTLAREGPSVTNFARASIHTFLFFAALRGANAAALATETADDLAVVSQWRLSPALYAHLVLQLEMQVDAVLCFRWISCAEGQGWVAACQSVLRGIADGNWQLLHSLLPSLLDPTLPGCCPPSTPVLLSALVTVIPTAAEGTTDEAVYEGALTGPLSRLVSYGLKTGWFEDAANGVVTEVSDIGWQQDGKLWAVQTLSELIASGVGVSDVSPQLQNQLAASIDASISLQKQGGRAMSLPSHFTARCHLRMQLMLHPPTLIQKQTPPPLVQLEPQSALLEASYIPESMYSKLVMGCRSYEGSNGCAMQDEIGEEAMERAMAIAAVGCLPGQPSMLVPSAVLDELDKHFKGNGCIKGVSALRVAFCLAGMLKKLLDGGAADEQLTMGRMLIATLRLVAAPAEQNSIADVLLLHSWFEPLRIHMRAEAGIGAALRADAERSLVSISNRMVGNASDDCGLEDPTEALMQELLPHVCLFPESVLSRLLSDGLQHSGQMPAVQATLSRLPALFAIVEPNQDNAAPHRLLVCSELRRQLGLAISANPHQAPSGVISACCQLLTGLLDAKLLPKDAALSDLALPLVEDGVPNMLLPGDAERNEDGNFVNFTTRVALAVGLEASRLSLGLHLDADAAAQDCLHSDALLAADTRHQVSRLFRLLLNISGLPRSSVDWLAERATACELLRSLGATIDTVAKRSRRPSCKRAALAVLEQVAVDCSRASWSARLLLADALVTVASHSHTHSERGDSVASLLTCPSLASGERPDPLQLMSDWYAFCARGASEVNDWHDAALPSDDGNSMASTRPAHALITSLTARLAAEVGQLDNRELRRALLAQGCRHLPGCTPVEAAYLADVAVPALVQARVSAAQDGGVESRGSLATTITSAARAVSLDLFLRCAVVLARGGFRQDARAVLRQYCAAAESAISSTKPHDQALLLACRCLDDTVSAASTLAEVGADISSLSLLLLQLLERLASSDSESKSEDMHKDALAKDTTHQFLRFDRPESAAQLLRLIQVDKTATVSIDSSDGSGEGLVVWLTELLAWATARVGKAPPSIRPMLDVAVARVVR